MRNNELISIGQPWISEQIVELPIHSPGTHTTFDWSLPTTYYTCSFPTLCQSTLNICPLPVIHCPSLANHLHLWARPIKNLSCSLIYSLFLLPAPTHTHANHLRLWVRPIKNLSCSLIYSLFLLPPPPPHSIVAWIDASLSNDNRDIIILHCGTNFYSLRTTRLSLNYCWTRGKESKNKFLIRTSLGKLLCRQQASISLH